MYIFCKYISFVAFEGSLSNGLTVCNINFLISVKTLLFVVAVYFQIENKLNSIWIVLYGHNIFSCNKSFN